MWFQHQLFWPQDRSATLSRARVPDEVFAVAAEDGLLEEALDEPVLVHPTNGPSSAAFDGRLVIRHAQFPLSAGSISIFY